MALSQAEFGRAVEGLEGAWREVLGDEPGVCSNGAEWESVELRTDDMLGTRYLRIRREVHTQGRIPENGGDKIEHEDEGIVEEDDPEALIPAPHPRPHDRGPGRIAIYDIVHSPSYQVPVLYLTFSEPKTMESVPLPSIDDIYQMLVPDSFKKPMRDVGIMGALSMAEHPISGTPAFFVHPCRTQDVITALSGGCDKPEIVERYLMLWLGAIGGSVGLSIPVSVAQTLTTKRGEA